MSLRPTALALTGNDGMYVVIDDPGTTGPLLIPCSWAHRRIDVTREQLAEDFELHPARSPQPNEQRYREALEEIARGMAGPDGMEPRTPWPPKAAMKLARAALKEETP